jgi:NAD-dependent SIR2 family protein deacetylase
VSADYPSLLRGTAADDYRFQDLFLADLVERARSFLEESDAVLIGAGAGLSASAGLSWGDTPRWREHFADFIAHYGPEEMPDMYTAGFHDFESPEEYWAFWARDILVNDILPQALDAYRTLHALVESKPHFVLTTNVDHQFYKAGFDPDRIFAMQGDGTKLCCSRGCTDEVYEAGPVVTQLVEATVDRRVPADMLPACPRCGAPLAMQMTTSRSRAWWQQGQARYQDFLAAYADKNLLLLELGVGISSPMNIRFPFEWLLRDHPAWQLVRVADPDAQIPGWAYDRSCGIRADIASTLTALAEKSVNRNETGLAKA